MSRNQTLIHHELIIFYIIQNKIGVKASFNHICEVVKALIIRIFVNYKVIHENLYALFHKVRKDTDHALLGGGWCVAKVERHLSIGESLEGACKSGLFLIFGGD